MKFLIIKAGVHSALPAIDGSASIFCPLGPVKTVERVSVRMPAILPMASNGGPLRVIFGLKGDLVGGDGQGRVALVLVFLGYEALAQGDYQLGVVDERVADAGAEVELVTDGVADLQRAASLLVLSKGGANLPLRRYCCEREAGQPRGSRECVDNADSFCKGNPIVRSLRCFSRI
ncbi:MAG: hypothetical protein Q3999_03915 [Buchananella hordeovulneris]|nr:hypothetical protein [Buchananella hordeovulneris]